MKFKDISNLAIEIRKKYSKYEVKSYGREWTKEQIAQGLVGDVGDLMKLIMAKSGIRVTDNVDEKLAHELSDCLWSIIVLADQYNIDLEDAFIKTMKDLETKIDLKLS